MKSATSAAVNTNKIFHYFQQSNQFKTVESLSHLIENNLFTTKNKDIVLINKPPNFILKGWATLFYPIIT
jgi:hypothetical protein